MNKDNYNLSVIVPVYNGEFTLKRCIESILNQSYRDFELLLVDDGSRDKSSDICDEYAQRDSRVRVFHTENSGPFQARRLGAERAAGEILAFSDADDWLEENAFEVAYKIFCKYNPDILAYTYDYGEGRIEKHLYEERLYCRTEIRDEIIPGMMYDSGFGGRRLNPSLCCKWIKKKLFKEVTKSVKDRITLGEDALVTYPAICKAERIFICNMALYHYSLNQSSCTHTYPLERVTEVKAFQDNLMRLFDEMGMLAQMKWQTENYIRSFFALMVKAWYGITLSPVIFSFPYNLIQRGSRLLFYGAGEVGRSYVNELKLTEYAQIVGWADKNYESIREYNGVNVIAPERIREKKFDKLLIAVWDEEMSKSIKVNLAKLGISEEKMVWRKPVRIV